MSASIPVPNENEAYVFLLHGHFQRFISRLRAIPPARWEWQPAVTGPCPRVLAMHAWQWLVCDRQHITEPDATLHPRVPEPPADQQALCDLLQEEADWWRGLLERMTPEEFLQPRWRWRWSGPVNMRWLVCHMTGNVIYKHGQLATLYFSLGLDGEDPYKPPLPNDAYDQLTDMRSHPLIRAVVDRDIQTLGTILAEGGEVDVRDRRGMTALHYAANIGETAILKALLEAGADVDARYGKGYTALMDAADSGKTEAVRVLLAHGAAPNAQDQEGNTALTWATMMEHSEVESLLRHSSGKE